MYLIFVPTIWVKYHGFSNLNELLTFQKEPVLNSMHSLGKLTSLHDSTHTMFHRYFGFISAFMFLSNIWVRFCLCVRV